MNGFSDAVSITAISTKHKSDEHLLLLHRRICCKSGHLTKQKEPRLFLTLVISVLSEFHFHGEAACEEVVGVRLTCVWWRRWGSNP